MKNLAPNITRQRLLIEGFYNVYIDKKAIKNILRKLMSMKPAKWGESHTEDVNLVKGLPSHLRGAKVVDKAIKELFHLEFLTKAKKTGEWHISLNQRKKEEIYRFLGIPPQ